MPKSLLRAESCLSGLELSLAIFSTADRLRRPLPSPPSELSESDIAGLVGTVVPKRNCVGP